MVRLSSKKKSHDVGRRAQQDLEELVDFSSFKGITTVHALWCFIFEGVPCQIST